MRRWIILFAVAAVIAAGIAFIAAMFAEPDEHWVYDAVSADAAQATPEIGAILTALNECVAETARRFPDSPEAMDLMAELHYRFGKAENAEAWWRKCLANAPDYVPAHHALATLATDRGDYAAAADRYREALALAPESSVYPVQLAEALMQTGELDEAIGILEQDLRRHPASMPCHTMLGLAYVQAQRDEEGRRCLERAIAMAPDYTNSYFALAKACARLGDREQSAEYMREFQRLKQQDEQRHRESLKSADDIGSVRATAAQYYTNAAKIYIASGDVERGESLLLLAGDLSGGCDESRLMLAWLYQRQGKRAAALAILAAVAASAADDLDSQMHLGESFAELGELQAAERAFRRVIELRPQQPGGYVALANLYMQTQSKLPAARQLAEQVVQLEPVSKNFVLLAMACQAGGDRQGAREAMDRAISLDPDNNQLRQFRRQLGED